MPGRPARRSGLLLGIAFASAGCIQERLLVDVTTVVRPDGSCSRRVEYRLEHADGKAETPVPLTPDEDGLRLFHRFPQGDAWTVRDETGPELHSVIAEAALSSPNEIGSDYWRVLAPRGPPAGNYVSFAMDRRRRGRRSSTPRRSCVPPRPWRA